MDNLSIRIPKELKKRLQEFCKRQNRPVSEVVRDSLRRHLAMERFRSVPILSPRAFHDWLQ